MGQTARECSDNCLDEHFTQTYGIFAGGAASAAVYSECCTLGRRRAVAPCPAGASLKNGGLELLIPYSDLRELIMDILKYGREVEVLRPKKLRDAVVEPLSKTTAQYKK